MPLRNGLSRPAPVRAIANSSMLCAATFFGYLVLTTTLPAQSPSPRSAVSQSPSSTPQTPATVSAHEFSQQVFDFLRREVTAHVQDIKSLNPPPQRVVGAQTGGQFDWGTFMRAVAAYAALTGDETIAGKDVPKFIGQLGLIEARQGGKTFAQLAGALSLRSYGTDLKTNPVWQALTPEEQTEWRSLLDLGRFYDKKTRHVIHLPENYFGVAARIASMDYQLGIITDSSFANDVVDRAAEQFTRGNLYADDAFPTGRYDRYSNEYARFVYEAAENIDRKDLMAAMEPTLKAQMRSWWDLVSPDGYGYPWGRSNGAISYMDTLEIVAFLSKHPQFRPAPLPELATAYYGAWQWLLNDYLPERHLLNVFGFGRGNYSYITPEREWQQTTAFLGKVAAAHATFMETLKKERISSFPSDLRLPDVSRFEFFRRGDRPAGVWLVRLGAIRFALPITAGVRPGVSDYLPAPYNFSLFSAPVEQSVPSLTPYLQLEDGRTIVAGTCADDIQPSADGLSLRVIWKHWAVLGGKLGEEVDPGLTSEVTWKIDGNSLIRSENISGSRHVAIRQFWVVVPTTAASDGDRMENGQRLDRFESPQGNFEVIAIPLDFKISTTLVATGNTAIGRGMRGEIPMFLDLKAHDLAVDPGKDLSWKLILKQIAPSYDKKQ